MNTLCKTLSIFKFWFSGILFTQFLPNFLNASPEFQLSWPTPNPSFARGLGYSTFLQKTGPEKPITSGAFGCVRNGGYKFHEGLDLFPVKKDKSGRAEDSVFAAMSGIVSHINSTSAHSAYGKYIVLEHTHLKPAIYTLYAHLASISPDLKVGGKVSVAQNIAKMGNTASGYHIPLQRSHLHFEVGLRLSNNFQKWYDKKSFKSKNRHSNFSGYNLVGFDPLLFYSKYKQKEFSNPLEFLKSLPVITVVRVKTSQTPNLLFRYPSMCDQEKPSMLYGWDISFGPYGLPLNLKPISPKDCSK